MDDLGAHDVTCYGSTYYETPNIDRLATRGLKFTQAYAASPLCSPTRSSILVGQYPARTGITMPECHYPEIQRDKKLVPGKPVMGAINALSLTRLKGVAVRRGHTRAVDRRLAGKDRAGNDQRGAVPERRLLPDAPGDVRPHAACRRPTRRPRSKRHARRRQQQTIPIFGDVK